MLTCVLSLRVSTTPFQTLDTAIARNARGDPVESTEGNAMSATKELGATKSPDEKVETVLARDAR